MVNLSFLIFIAVGDINKNKYYEMLCISFGKGESLLTGLLRSAIGLS